jgi:hypothetical protein
VKRLPPRLVRVSRFPQLSEVFNLVAETQSLVDHTRQAVRDAQDLIERARAASARWSEERSPYAGPNAHITPHERRR